MHASDMLALLPALERANLDMDFTDALAELFPDCEAFLFQNTGKLVRARDVRSHGLSGADRYIRFGLHARFFNVEGTDDMVVDTLGMGTLFMPDLQYHFHSLDPNRLVHHACSTALYILENDCPIKSGEIIDGVEAETGRISRSVPWRCRYEQALIQLRASARHRGRRVRVGDAGGLNARTYKNKKSPRLRRGEYFLPFS